MRARLVLLVLAPIGIGAQNAADAPILPSGSALSASAPSPVDSEENSLNEKRRAIHRDALKDRDSEVPLSQDQTAEQPPTLNATDAPRVKKSSKKRGGWLWGGDDEESAAPKNQDESVHNEANKSDGEGLQGHTSSEKGSKDSSNHAGDAQKEDADSANASEAAAGPSNAPKFRNDEDSERSGEGVKANGLSLSESVSPSAKSAIKVPDRIAQDKHTDWPFKRRGAKVSDDAQATTSKRGWNNLLNKQGDEVASSVTTPALEGNATREAKQVPLQGGSQVVVAPKDADEKKNELQMAGNAGNVQTVVDGLEISLGDPGNPERWAVMQRAGVPSAQFECGLADSKRLFQVSSLQAVSSLLVSDDSIGSRVDLDDSEDDIWNLHRPFHLLSGNSKDDDGDMIIHLKNFTITTELVTPGSSSGVASAADLVQVYTSPVVEAGGLVVTSNDNVDMIYVCKAAGVARIKIQAIGNGGASYCFEWIKHCNPTWDGFQVLETGTGKTVAEDGRVTAGWQPASVGSTVSFMLTHPGSEGSVRMKGASVTSSNPNVNVTLRGALDTILNETAPVANIITIVADIAEQVDVIYSCADGQDEQTEVVLKFYNEAAAIAPLEIPWTAHCSNQAINDISATISSCRAKKNGASLQQSQAMFKGDVADNLQKGAITIAADDDCTALLFSTESPESVVELFPSHQLVYDRRILMVANKVGSVETTITGDTLLRIPYVCLDEGVSDVALTVYFKNKSSADFHWKKACRKPGVHTSAMLTGHHIFAIIMALFLTSFLLCFISRSRTLTQFILRKLGDCCPWCCRRRQSNSSDERTQFTAFGVAV